MSIPKTVDSSLRSDSFTAILTDLENASLSLSLFLFVSLTIWILFCFVGEKAEGESRMVGGNSFSI